MNSQGGVRLTYWIWSTISKVGFLLFCDTDISKHIMILSSRIGETSSQEGFFFFFFLLMYFSRMEKLNVLSNEANTTKLTLIKYSLRYLEKNLLPNLLRVGHGCAQPVTYLIPTTKVDIRKMVKISWFGRKKTAWICAIFLRDGVVEMQVVL